MARELLKDLIYGEQIISDSCKVDLAVGMTYSLNLEAMLTVPLAFGALGELDSDVRQSPAYLLEGIRRTSDKIVLFCNKGSISVPKEAREIYSLLENSIFEVQNDVPRHKDILSNFHPKIWLVKETDQEGGSWLKLAVMSRNLEFSSCLDICCTLRGKIRNRRSIAGSRRHTPLKEMLLWLSGYADRNNAAKVRDLAEMLDYVEKFELDEPFQTKDEQNDEGYDFFPFVYNKPEFIPYNEPLRQIMQGERILIVSPFIDIDTFTWLTNRKKMTIPGRSSAILITKKEYVTQGVFDLFDEVWIPNDTMLDNTTALVDIHAKMYLVQQYSREPIGYTLYLGSTNATKNGFGRNTEFLLSLHYKRTTNDRINELKEEIVGENRFIKMDAPNPEATDERPSNNEEMVLKNAINLLKKAVITPGEDERCFNIELHTKYKAVEGIRIRPIQCQKYWQPLSEHILFNGIDLSQLSVFYVLSIPQQDSEKPLEMVAKIDTKGMPDTRDEAIYRCIVRNKEELMDYVAFMLSDRPAEFYFEQKLLKEEKGRNNRLQNQATWTMPLYEQLLRTASSNPSQITEVQRFVNKMDPKIVPAELTQMLDMFKNVAKQIARV